MSALQVRVRDERGTPIPARVAVRCLRDGEPAWPSGEHLRYDIVEAWGEERSFVCDGDAALDVPSGRYEVRVSRGTDWTSWRSVETVMPERAREVVVTLAHPVDPAARGWIAGDVHVHRAPAEAVRLAMAEDVRVIHCLTRYLDIPIGAEPVRLAASEPPSLGATAEGALIGAEGALIGAEGVVIGAGDVEIERIMGGPGALIGLGAGALPALEIDAWTPFDDVLAAGIRAAGGIVDGEKVVWPGVPVLAALGLLDTVELACNHFGPGWTLGDLGAAGAVAPDGGITSPRALVDWIFECYAALLACGFRVAASGGSGAGVMPAPVGASRVHARVDGPLSMASWLAALRAGRTVSTNGPLVELDVDGAGPGDRPGRSGHAVRPVRVRASSPRALERVEIVADAEVVGEWRPGVGAAGEWRPGGSAPNTVEAEVDLDLSAVSWIAARAVEVQEDPSAIRFAHTSPVWTGRLPRARRRRLAAARVGNWLEATERLVGEEEQRRGCVLEEARGALVRARAVVEARVAGVRPGGT